jgi:UDP-N-acetylglucosamine acyltransferase
MPNVIDARAVIDPSARIGANVTIGPYAIIGKDVEIGDGCVIGPHAVINGPTRLGKDNRVFQFASIGDAPQDKKYRDEPTRLEIGDRNVIREFCTINRGTVQDEGVTRVGNDNWIMAYVHIAHDCRVGSNIIMANNASIAGHVHVGDHAILGGFTVAHQFCAIGEYAFTGLGTIVTKDLPPYVLAMGNTAEVHGLNLEGLRRHGFDANVLSALKNAYKVIFRSGKTMAQAIEELEPSAREIPQVAVMVQFLKRATRGIVR